MINQQEFKILGNQKLPTFITECNLQQISVFKTEV